MSDKAEKLLNFTIDEKFNINFSINSEFILYVLALIVAYALYQIFILRKFKSFEIDEAEIGIGNQKIKLRPNLVDMQIAYKIWVELSTRKIGLPIDYDNDVIVEVYSSWYGFFSVARELVKDVPVSNFRRKDTEKIINLSIEVLNKGIRPHLTKWQARYRRWYERVSVLPENESKTPQEIQCNYPYYEELVADLRTVNACLIQYRIKMHQIISKA
ncbi:hypothetical protein [Psychromonas hadalis]|uniref:hypothetical protein n=1 Tax=Psychromonas hadalis TaxID=211669 RepID=UPI0003B3059A|nr:hypothetical protein [Psychromonas hadalis]